MDDIIQLQQKLLSERQSRRARVLICMTGCRALGAKDVAEKFKEGIKTAALEDKVAIVETVCIGICAKAPVMLIEPYGYVYGGVKPEDVDEIISETIEKGQVIERLAVVQDGLLLHLRLVEDVPNLQQRLGFAAQKHRNLGMHPIHQTIMIHVCV